MIRDCPIMEFVCLGIERDSRDMRIIVLKVLNDIVFDLFELPKNVCVFLTCSIFYAAFSQFK